MPRYNVFIRTTETVLKSSFFIFFFLVQVIFATFVSIESPIRRRRIAEQENQFSRNERIMTDVNILQRWMIEDPSFCSTMKAINTRKYPAYPIAS